MMIAFNNGLWASVVVTALVFLDRRVILGRNDSLSHSSIIHLMNTGNGKVCVYLDFAGKCWCDRISAHHLNNLPF